MIDISFSSLRVLLIMTTLFKSSAVTLSPFMVAMLGQPHDTLLAEFEITSLPHSLHLTLIIVFKRILF